MADLHADPATLEGVASRLRGAAGDLESQASGPPLPDLGEVNALVGSCLAELTDALGRVSDATSALGNAVAQGRDVYVDTDDSGRQRLDQHQRDLQQGGG